MISRLIKLVILRILQKYFICVSICFSLLFAEKREANAQCAGITINGYSGNPIAFTGEELKAGRRVSEHITLLYQLPPSTDCVNWSLRVRLTQEFSSGSSIFPPGNVSLRFNRTTGSLPGNIRQVVLSTAESAIIDRSPVAIKKESSSVLEQKFDLIIAGLKSNAELADGFYNTVLAFTLVNAQNRLMASFNVPLSIHVKNGGIESISIQLQNNSQFNTFKFDTPASLIDGLSIERPKGLKITANEEYEVFVKTLNSELLSAGGVASIPVSLINLEMTPAIARNGITCYTVALSGSDQLVIKNAFPLLSPKENEFNLKYFIKPNMLNGSNPPGVYSTTLIFTAIPK